MRYNQRTTIRSFDDLCDEVRRVELALERIETKMHDPDGDLARTVRLSVCERELLAYLNGLRYAMGGEAPPIEVMEPAGLKSTA
jgi:hypothetical protein